MKSHEQKGFTRVELMACVGGLVLLLTVIAPTLATSGSRADRVVCFNNVRHLGNAFRQYAMENNDSPPWSRWAPTGNYNDPGKNELWFQYWWIRDGIGSPTYLMDPAETHPSARVATNWDLDGDRGFQTLKNVAVSYVLGLDSATFLPRSIVVADRHIVDSGLGGCSSGINRAARLPTWPSSTVRWRAEVHGEFGNVALADGSVESVDSEGLRRTVSEVRDGNGEVHIMKGWF